MQMHGLDDIFNFIVDYKQRRGGIAPAKGDIAQAVGVTSATADDGLRRLAEEGRLKIKASPNYLQPRYITVAGGRYELPRQWPQLQGSPDRDTFNALRRYKLRHDGVPPTVFELGQALGGLSPEAAGMRLQKLEFTGAIERENGYRKISIPGERWVYAPNPARRTEAHPDGGLALPPGCGDWKAHYCSLHPQERAELLPDMPGAMADLGSRTRRNVSRLLAVAPADEWFDLESMAAQMPARKSTVRQWLRRAVQAGIMEDRNTSSAAAYAWRLSLVGRIAQQRLMEAENG